MLERLRTQHAEIGELSKAFAATIDGPAGDVGTVGALRWELCRKLLDHIADEDRFVCERLIATGNVEAVSSTLEFQSDLGGLRDEILRYRGEWSLDRIRAEWPAFCQASSAVLARVGRRVDREEADLYPLAERLVYSANKSEAASD